MIRFLRRSPAKTDGATAVCLYPGRIDVARIQRTSALPVVLALESYERGASDLDALTRLARRYKLADGACSTLLSGGDYQLLQLEIPAGDQGLRAALATRVAEMIDQPLMNVTYDAVIIPTAAFAPGRAQSAYVVVAGNAVVAPRVQLFHQAKLGLVAIDIPEMAQRNLAALCEVAGRALAFLTFDQNEGLLTFTCNGELYMARHLDLGLKQLLTDDAEKRSTLFDRIGLEVQRSLDNFDRQFGFLPLSQVLIGPYAEAPALRDYLADYLAVTVDVLDLAEVLDFSRIPELRRIERQAECLQTLGAALRVELAA